MKPLSRLRKTLYLIVGSLCFVLGGLGIFLPVLPTTPFWLLTAWFYLRSSEPLYRKVMGIPLFGKTVRNFQRYRAIPLHAKIIAISMIWGSTLLSALLVGKFWVWIVLIGISTAVTVHILSYKTLTKEQRRENP